MYSMLGLFALFDRLVIHIQASSRDDSSLRRCDKTLFLRIAKTMMRSIFIAPSLSTLE
jgi:hypothetical protein